MSESRVRIPLKSLAAKPTVDSLGDRLPSGLKHHVMPHVSEILGVKLVRPADIACDAPPPEHLVAFQNEQRCRHQPGPDKVANTHIGGQCPEALVLDPFEAVPYDGSGVRGLNRASRTNAGSG